jgi:hypothetical protein
MIAIGVETEMKTTIQTKGRLAAGALAVAMTASAIAAPACTSSKLLGQAGC